MSRKRTLDLVETILTPDNMAKQIADFWRVWDMDRVVAIERMQEISKYVFATDTRATSNSKLPWKNSTTIPKLCQIRDNLQANYLNVLFPKRKWMKWFPDNEESMEKEKASAIQDYMSWSVDQSGFKTELRKCVLDYIDSGNAFAIPEWVDFTAEGNKFGYVGPRLARISPLDVVMNPTAPSTKETPFIVRSWHTIGEMKRKLMKAYGNEAEEARDIFNYLTEIRRNAAGEEANLVTKDEIYNVAGFNSFRDYLGSSFVEVLTFYGDLYDMENDILYENHVISIVDRHKIISMRPHESVLGMPPIIHIGWRERQDNLWAMGPLDNLVGLQYRIDHLENMKADVLDLTVFPPIMIKGLIEDFEWGPGERIYVQDDGDVKLMGPDTSVLQVNIEIANIMELMEQMAGAPKEALGFRTPGEKTAYEVQRLENAAGRLFINRAISFEEFIEEGLNLMLELARRRADPTLTRIFDDEAKVFTFRTISSEDLAGAGRIKPIGARHFAEQAELVQNLSNMSQTPLGQDPLVTVHMSGKKIAKLFEDVLNLQDYNIFSEYVRVAEQAEMASMQTDAEEQVLMQAEQPSGLTPDDYDPDLLDTEGQDPNEEPVQ